MMRIFLFLATNIAIMIVISIVFNLLGLSGTLDAQGIDLNLNALLVMSAVIGMTGSVHFFGNVEMVGKKCDGRSRH